MDRKEGSAVRQSLQSVKVNCLVARRKIGASSSVGRVAGIVVVVVGGTVDGGVEFTQRIANVAAAAALSSLPAAAAVLPFFLFIGSVVRLSAEEDEDGICMQGR